jgi:hypothetical protein
MSKAAADEDLNRYKCKDIRPPVVSWKRQDALRRAISRIIGDWRYQVYQRLVDPKPEGRTRSEKLWLLISAMVAGCSVLR